jgi:putative transposase
MGKKLQRRLNGVEEIVLSLYENGLTTSKHSAYFAEVYRDSVSKETISKDHRRGYRGDE